MADSGGAIQLAHNIVAIEIASDLAGGAMRVEILAIIGSYARGFLAAMLQSVKTKRNNGGCAVCTMNAENAALFAQLIVIKGMSGEHIHSRARKGVGRAYRVGGSKSPVLNADFLHLIAKWVDGGAGNNGYRAGMNVERDSVDRFMPRFDAAGLVTAIVTDADSGNLLMVAHMNQQAIDLSFQTGQVHFWSRSRQSLWRKGETSGNGLSLVEMLVDCDQDALLVRVKPAGPSCHTGRKSCFYRRINADGSLLFLEAAPKD